MKWAPSKPGTSPWQAGRDGASDWDSPYSKIPTKAKQQNPPERGVSEELTVIHGSLIPRKDSALLPLPIQHLKVCRVRLQPSFAKPFTAAQIGSNKAGVTCLSSTGEDKTINVVE